MDHYILLHALNFSYFAHCT